MFALNSAATDLPKPELYRDLAAQLKALLAGERDFIAMPPMRPRSSSTPFPT